MEDWMLDMLVKSWQVEEDRMLDMKQEIQTSQGGPDIWQWFSLDRSRLIGCWIREGKFKQAKEEDWMFDNSEVLTGQSWSDAKLVKS